ncbi:MAG: hypothetical protein [Circular genetic element sp.]|nr:MAG: hypothetical protein [Circular genetic element sp.]
MCETLLSDRRVNLQKITLDLSSLIGHSPSLMNYAFGSREIRIHWSKRSKICLTVDGSSVYLKTNVLDAIWFLSPTNGEDLAVLTYHMASSIPTLYLQSSEQFIMLQKLLTSETEGTNRKLTMTFGN